MRSLLKQSDYSREWVKDFYTQAGIWWGDDPQAPGEHARRVDLVNRLCGPGPWQILDLGAGSGRTAAALADAGHSVTAVELNPTDAASAREFFKTPRRGPVVFVEGDFYTVELPPQDSQVPQFDVVLCWQVFGIGSDADQRRLLNRISREWLKPHGSAILDIYHPAGPARDHGKEWRLAPLPGVPGSVEMFERCRYDPVHGRWIDEWQPVEHPENTLAQSLRCYTPADLALLLEGTGLRIKQLILDDRQLDLTPDQQTERFDLFARDYNYLVQLVQTDNK